MQPANVSAECHTEDDIVWGGDVASMCGSCYREHPADRECRTEDLEEGEKMRRDRACQALYEAAEALEDFDPSDQVLMAFVGLLCEMAADMGRPNLSADA